MQLRVTKLDNKYKRKSTRSVKKQREFDVMEKSVSKDAISRFREEPYQLRYQRMREEHENKAKI